MAVDNKEKSKLIPLNQFSSLRYEKLEFLCYNSCFRVLFGNE